jgi:hypothetical protein
MATNKLKAPAALDTVIASIDVNLTTHFRDATPHEQYLADYNECPLCGTEMLFTHVTNFVRGDVHEEAHCEACKIRVRDNSHQLQ